MDVASILNRCELKAEREGLGAISPVERVVVLASRANLEVELGGLASFYASQAGDESVATVAALEAIGASGAAAALAGANALFPGGSPPRDRAARRMLLAAIQRRPDRLMEPTEDAFVADDPDVFARLCSYIETNAVELGEGGLIGI